MYVYMYVYIYVYVYICIIWALKGLPDLDSRVHETVAQSLQKASTSHTREIQVQKLWGPAS